LGAVRRCYMPGDVPLKDTSPRTVLVVTARINVFFDGFSGKNRHGRSMQDQPHPAQQSLSQRVALFAVLDQVQPALFRFGVDSQANR